MALSPIESFLAANRVSQALVARNLNISAASASRKLAGERPWKLHEIQALQQYLSTLLGRSVSFDELLSGQPVAIESKSA